MKCSQCKSLALSKSVEKRPRSLCEKHFLVYFEKKVKNTIVVHRLFTKKHKLAVACSGGKDSITILLLLHEWGYDVTGLLIDEGIADYREHTRAEFETICAQRGIRTKILTYEECMGSTLDHVLHKHPSMRPCTVCGVFRRSLLQRGAKGFDILVTGHNLDDEAQGILMNLLSGQTALLSRMGPLSRGEDDFIPRAKPLYLCSEKEIRLYTLLKRLPISFHQCPHAGRAFRNEFSSALNKMESIGQGAKLRVVASFLRQRTSLRAHVTHKEVLHCASCGQPSAHTICKACEFRKTLVMA